MIFMAQNKRVLRNIKKISEKVTEFGKKKKTQKNSAKNKVSLVFYFKHKFAITLGKGLKKKQDPGDLGLKAIRLSL